MVAEVQPSKPAKPPKRSRNRAATKKAPAWHPAFLRMLPAIRKQARSAFGHLDPEARGEAVQEATASATVAFKRLWDRGKADRAYPSALARYGIQRVKVGRRVGTRQNVRDVSSEYCQIEKRLVMQRLDYYDRQQDGWREVLIEDRRAGPAETAASRIDFPAWLKTLRRRNRQIAWRLALGETTRHVARWFNLSTGRISQMRRELEQSWRAFHGEPAA